MTGAKIATSRLAGHAAALPAGQEIGAGNQWKANQALVESSWGNSSGVYSSGNWHAKKDRFLGLQFQIAGATHYGWARLTEKNEGAGNIEMTITSFAYETEPNKAIRAGQMKDEPNEDGSGQAEPAMPPEATDSLGALALGAGGISIWRRQ